MGQISKKTSISWGLCTGTKCGKVVLFGFSTGTKSEILNFYSSNILNSKSNHFFAFGTGTKTPRNRSFFGYFYRSKYLIFEPKNFGAAFGTWYYIQKNVFKTFSIER
jgi:hypothetical protein